MADALPRIGKKLTAAERAQGLQLVFNPDRLQGADTFVRWYMDAWALYPCADDSQPPTHMGTLDALHAAAEQHGAKSLTLVPRYASKGGGSRG